MRSIMKIIKLYVAFHFNSCSDGGTLAGVLYKKSEANATISNRSEEIVKISAQPKQYIARSDAILDCNHRLLL